MLFRSSSPDTAPAGLARRLDAGVNTSLDDLRAWFCLQAVNARRQLVEVLSQFLENHFVTYHDKSVDYLNRYYQDFPLLDRLATDLEYREMHNWRNQLQNTNCTFYDLLKISAESPAMIIFLDTVDSKGNVVGPPNLRTNIANENYARELFELFCTKPLASARAIWPEPTKLILVSTMLFSD